MTAHDRHPHGNDEYLAAALDWLRLRLRWYAEQVAPPVAEAEERPGIFVRLWRFLFGGPRRRWSAGRHPEVTRQEIDDAAAAMESAAKSAQPAPALVALAAHLDLSPFEQSVLLLCAAVELDTRIPALCARAQDPPYPYPTLALAFSVFDEPAWDVRSPRRSLFRWRLVEAEVAGHLPLNSARLYADARIVNYLKGLNNYHDERLDPYLTLMPASGESLPPSQQGRVAAIVGHVREAMAYQLAPVVQLIGSDAESKKLIADQAAQALKIQLYVLPAEAIPTQSAEFETLALLCQREALLRPTGIYIDAHDMERGNMQEAQAQALRRFFERTGHCCLYLDVREAWPTGARPNFSLPIGRPTPEEQYKAWHRALGPDSGEATQLLTGQFSLNQHRIEGIGRMAQAQPAQERLGQAWNACLEQASRRFEGLTQRIEPRAGWQDIVLADSQRQLLQQIVGQVRQRLTVYDAWDFRSTLTRGLGISALFYGDSGTGKTFAAEVIAGELGLYLCNIDLSAVVSKYIGETEKNLRRVFDAAEEGGCVLCFNEADALFGKRSEVKDSHDRYANIEINYLLQRMESFGGLAVLTTNMKSALDPAFVRRLRFMVPFGFPGVAERAEIWRRSLPAKVPVSDEGLDFVWLARSVLTGASIKNVVLAGCFLAADAGEPLSMAHLLAALRTELTKLEQPIREADFRWKAPEGRAG